MIAENQSGVGTSGYINAPTTIDNSVQSGTVINAPSTAHAPFSPAGSGWMGMGTRG